MPQFEFDEPCANWTKLTVNKYLWAVSPDYEFCDLFHECYLKFLKINDGRYVIENQRHGMSLYMRASNNRLKDIYKRCQARPVIITEIEDEDGELVRMDNLIEDGLDHFAALDVEEEMSPPLRLLFERSSWEENIWRVRNHRTNSAGQRETTNHLLCRLAGVDPKVYNLRGELREFVAI